MTKCFCCGSEEEITVHHLKLDGRYNKQGQTLGGNKIGIIYLCRDCHNIVENIKEAIRYSKKCTLNGQGLSLTRFKKIVNDFDKVD